MITIQGKDGISTESFHFQWNRQPGGSDSRIVEPIYLTVVGSRIVMVDRYDSSG